MARKNGKCQAIAGSTGVRCKKKYIKGSRFCLWHSLGQPPLYITLIITVIVAIGSVVATGVWSDRSVSKVIGRIELVKEIVNSSNIDVCLKLSVNEKTKGELDNKRRHWDHELSDTRREPNRMTARL